jgi:hypothetical protein
VRFSHVLCQVVEKHSAGKLHDHATDTATNEYINSLGIYMADFDQSFINEVFRRLKVNSGSSLDFSHGQLSRTALYVIRQYGADWAPSVSPYQDSTEQRRFRRKLRMLIEQAVSVQGKSTKGVWCRFRLHAINKYSRLESKKIILRISSSL